MQHQAGRGRCCRMACQSSSSCVASYTRWTMARPTNETSEGVISHFAAVSADQG